MRKFLVGVSILIMCLLACNVFGQSVAASAGKTRLPLNVNQLPGMLSTPVNHTHLAFNRLSRSTNASLQGKGQPLMIQSIPTFNSAFTFQGQTFPFTMVGRNPQMGGVQQIPTSYLAISFFFDEFVDQNGNNIVIDATGNTNTFLNGPQFQNFPYANGSTQFADAVQRAEFFSTINKTASGAGSWHTVLAPPRQFTPITIEVPFFSSQVFVDDSGTFFAVIDINFMVSQLNTLVQTLGIQVTEIPMLLTHNAVYGDFFAGNFLDCCIGGFHTAFETQVKNNTVFIQTFAFATWLDSDVSAAIFGDPTIFADVMPISHEISETFNDPFISNVVPSYQVPLFPPGFCDNILETGDPVENLPNPSFPVTLNGFTYHPQTEALLEWFSREVPSSAFNGDFSFPGNNLTSPSMACPVGP